MRYWPAVVLAVICGACNGPNYPLPGPTPLPPAMPSITPTPPPPVEPTFSIQITGTPGTVIAGTSATWYAATQNGHGAVRYVWQLGDGSAALETAIGSLRATYGRSGSYTLTVQAIDADARTADTHAAVMVAKAPAPPPPVPPAPPPPAPTLSATLTCTPKAAGTATPCNVTTTYGSAPVPGSAISGVIIDWGDGSPTVNTAGTATPALARYAYLQPGSYMIVATVTATTVDGAKTASTSTAVVIP